MSIDYKLISKDKLTELVKSSGIETWNELIDFVQSLPYGRNKNRTDFSLVLSEMKGTCSSKHALLKSIADLNNVPDVHLIIGIYRMTELNTPKIGNELSKNSLDFIPEAHCYLRISGKRIDFTMKKSIFGKIENDILQELEVAPKQVTAFKIEYHKEFIKKWLAANHSDLIFDQIWEIRERCISNLSD